VTQPMQATACALQVHKATDEGTRALEQYRFYSSVVVPERTARCIRFCADHEARLAVIPSQLLESNRAARAMLQHLVQAPCAMLGRRRRDLRGMRYIDASRPGSERRAALSRREIDASQFMRAPTASLGGDVAAPSPR
jgi:hypothetical protein